ncbi:uncharacterized protein LOC141642879 [Silene latifolia]|uniref:uncharacterized protein LOC141642879 n=1 Tax=Silene latifolia TaxID=37657 RepID=UPI003D789813
MHFEEEKSGVLVGSCSSSSRKRQRFNVELKQDETVIISWKKLLRDARKIDQCPPLLNLIAQSSSAHQTLDDNSHVGQLNNSFLSDEKLGRRFSDNKQLMEGKKNDCPTRKLEGCEREYRSAVANGNSMLQKYLSCSNRSSVIRDHQLEGLHDVPVMYPKKYSTFNKHVKIADDKYLFPFKTKHDILQKNQRLCFEKSGINMKAANDLSDIMSHSSARKFTPLQTYQRSRNLMDGRKSKVEGKVQNENLVGLTMEPYVYRNPDNNPCLKRKLTSNKVAAGRPISISKSSHYSETDSVELSTKGNRSNVGQPPLLTEPKPEIPEKTNVRIKFHLKP